MSAVQTASNGVPDGPETPSRRYARIDQMIRAGRCVMLDGATGTELIEVLGQRPEVEEHLWGVTDIVDAPVDVRVVHRRYVDAGCDVISTNTWGLPTAILTGGPEVWDRSRPVHWMDVARRGIELARAAADEAGRTDEVAVAFSLNGDVDSEEGHETIDLLARAFQDEPPDLVLLETLSLVRPSTYDTVERLLAIGLPVWLSFRRCRHGVCGVYGEHWGGPEGDSFGRSARRFEEMGVSALLINCMPPDHVPGMLSWLRDFTDLPLGVYPNLGYLSSAGWRYSESVGAQAYAEMALGWREEGAHIIGGCCGVGPDHIAAAATALAGTSPGRVRRDSTIHDDDPGDPDTSGWSDGRGRHLFPLEVPEVLADTGVARPDQLSFLLWKYLAREAIGAHQRCLDIGCGTGLLTLQLACNGAAHVHAIDVDRAAAANTRANASRNGVGDRVTTATVDLFPWVPEERYDVIVANLDQVPIDPFGAGATHRPLDYWGRNLVDQLIQALPEALADDGVAYVVHLSIIGQRHTARQLEALGFACQVVDFALLPSDELSKESRDQIERVEDLSDAYHLHLGGTDVTVAYLLEITRKGEEKST